MNTRQWMRSIALAVILAAMTVAPRADACGQANQEGVYADSCGLKTAFLGNGGRKAATIFSLRYSSSR